MLLLHSVKLLTKNEQTFLTPMKILNYSEYLRNFKYNSNITTSFFLIPLF